MATLARLGALRPTRCRSSLVCLKRAYTTNVYTELCQRGLVSACTHPIQLERAVSQKTTVYAGFDPSGASLHVGHMLPLVTLKHFQRYGHRVIALVGGGTGLIGDPSGRSTERNALAADVVRHNVGQLDNFLKALFSGPDTKASVLVLNNEEWLGKLRAVDLIVDIGRHFRVKNMLAKDSVKGRMTGVGISFCEFSYQLLQAYDFYHLHKHWDCRIQVGGSDQWGNIVTGLDLIHRAAGRVGVSHEEEELGRDGDDACAFGITVPLLTNDAGEKIGKSSGNATVWLDSQLTSHFAFYQYFLNMSDTEALRFLPMLTFMPLPEVHALAEQHTARPEARLAQRALAREVTNMVRGSDGLAAAERATQALFQGNIRDLPVSQLRAVFSEVPHYANTRAALLTHPLTEVLKFSKLLPSKQEARRLISSGGVAVNGERVTDPEYVLTEHDLLEGQLCVVTVGKKRKLVVQVM
eukprot:CAMPEP_0177669118 /NCGR_PEP_ID=MMETSP0447-20121125/23240_1 /TAXON_ID=0 /ORGANISM="Stygamoeba regulata, Strain BSH-02190019" /LENGTH=466 /DNA_ID=CAMNT_0019175903 /DNA_START=170 /DNA_END=1570 /DNA_ORIENTATION=+